MTRDKPGLVRRVISNGIRKYKTLAVYSANIGAQVATSKISQIPTVGGILGPGLLIASNVAEYFSPNLNANPVLRGIRATATVGYGISTLLGASGIVSGFGDFSPEYFHSTVQTAFDATMFLSAWGDMTRANRSYGGSLKKDIKGLISVVAPLARNIRTPKISGEETVDEQVRESASSKPREEWEDIFEDPEKR